MSFKQSGTAELFVSGRKVSLFCVNFKYPSGLKFNSEGEAEQG